MAEPHTRLTVLIVVLALALVGSNSAARYHANQRYLPNWNGLPYQFDGWSGSDGMFEPVYGMDTSDTKLLRIYRQGDNSPVIVYVGFYEDLAETLEAHTPELCYPSQGWTILSTGRSAPGMFRGKQIPAREILVEKDGSRRLVMWWYNAGSRPLETRIRYIFAILAISTFTGRADGSLVRLETPIDAMGQSAANTRIEEFRARFLPALDKALPR